MNNNVCSSGNCGTVAGGVGNCVSQIAGFVGGGSSNSVAASAATIAGGVDNTASSKESFIGGGTKNTIKTAHGCASVVGTNINSVSGKLLHANSLYLVLSDIPTSDPGVDGVVWNSSGTLKVSQ